MSFLGNSLRPHNQSCYELDVVFLHGECGDFHCNNSCLIWFKYSKTLLLFYIIIIVIKILLKTLLNFVHFCDIITKCHNQKPMTHHRLWYWRWNWGYLLLQFPIQCIHHAMLFLVTPQQSWYRLCNNASHVQNVWQDHSMDPYDIPMITQTPWIVCLWSATVASRNCLRYFPMLCVLMVVLYTHHYQQTVIRP